jgi:hypothetical protein
MGDHCQRDGVANVAWSGVLLFRFDGTKIGVINDYVVVHSNVCGGNPGTFLLFLEGLIKSGSYSAIRLRFQRRLAGL